MLKYKNKGIVRLWGLSVFIFIFLFSCKKKSKELVEKREDTKQIPLKIIPFKKLDLSTLNAFNSTSENWKIVGDAYVDRTKQKTISGSNGTGVLLNIPSEENKKHLFTNFKHGDIEMEVDVMMPVGSNSGLYFQGRYEVQLFDSWGVNTPNYSDMGGIYQRWNKNQPKGQEGYEGHAPAINASKSPGLWQHFRILFHAPRFNTSGKKIKNAFFKEVWLNGRLIHSNIELTGPTRGASFIDEVSKGPLMIQADHGPVAIKNIRTKLYGQKKTSITNLKLKEYKSISKSIPSLDTMNILKEVTTDSISSQVIIDRLRKMVVYSGDLIIPTTGEYIFEFAVAGSGLLLIDKDTILNLDNEKEIDFGTTSLTEGKVPFTLIYNRNMPWTKGLGLYVEGPGDEKHALHANNSLDRIKRGWHQPLHIEVNNTPVTQRGFIMHKGVKRTHCISVGIPDEINYSYDLAFGTLLQGWDGNFLDVADMWHSRGQNQLALPEGFVISLNSDPDFAFLENKSSVWPDSIPSNVSYKQLGYEFDSNEIPTFTQKINNTTVSNTIVSAKDKRGLLRTIVIKGEKTIWHKIAEGDAVKKLPNGTYIVNNESYFIEFLNDESINAEIRTIAGKDELVVALASGVQHLSYTIFW